MAEIDLPFGKNSVRTPPDSQQLDTGHVCGPARRETFNWLAWWHSGQLASAMRQAGVTPDDANLDQVLDTLARYSSIGPYFIATGTPQAIILTSVNVSGGAAKPAPQAYFDGMEIEWHAASPNTAADPTVNVNGLGNRTITRPDNTNAQAGDVKGRTVARYEAANSVFRLRPWSEGLLAPPPSGPPSSPKLPMMFYRADGTQNFPHGTGVNVQYKVEVRKQVVGNTTFTGDTTLTIAAEDAGVWAIIAGIDFRGAGAGGGLNGLDHRIYQVGVTDPVAVDNRTSSTSANLGSVVTHVQDCVGGEQFYVQSYAGLQAGSGQAQPSPYATRFAALKLSI